MTDEFRQLRRRQADLARRLRPGPDRPSGSGVMVGRVVDGGAIPDEVPRVFLVRPDRLSVDLLEGATPTETAADGSVPVLVLGPTVPGVGDRVTAKLCDGIWVAGEGSGGGTGQPPLECSGCEMPNTFPGFVASSVFVGEITFTRSPFSISYDLFLPGTPPVVCPDGWVSNAFTTINSVRRYAIRPTDAGPCVGYEVQGGDISDPAAMTPAFINQTTQGVAIDSCDPLDGQMGFTGNSSVSLYD